MEAFTNALELELLDSDANEAITENGAKGIRTTGNALLDLNFAVSSARSWPDDEIRRKFAVAMAENPILAPIWLFFCRDCRGGLGERRFFRVAFRYLAENHPDCARKTMHLIPFYGRWDDLFVLLDTPLADECAGLLRRQMSLDLKGVTAKEPISLLGKWLPSINAHASRTRKQAVKVCVALGLTPKLYQQACSVLRGHLDVVERSMSANRWGQIGYAAVPSKANLIYSRAFMRHDPIRRKAFLSDLKEGKGKINASVLYPCDIVSRYRNGSDGAYKVDDTLEAAWKALPDYGTGMNDVLVVSDGSGSMEARIGGTNVLAWDVAASLAIYYAERMTGSFHNTYITFSGTPQLVRFHDDSSLAERIQVAQSHSDWTNTDIAKTFRLILDTAWKNNLPQEEMPKTLLIISDMEFDGNIDFDGRLFDGIRRDFEDHGYTLPRLVFWNVASRSNAIPLRENSLGVALVSGFSPSISDMILSQKLDPWEVLLDTLGKPRYRPVADALNGKESDNG